MGKFKLFVMGLGFLAFMRYFPVVYNAAQFNDFVKNEAQRSQMETRLRTALLRQAEAYFLPIQPDDISVHQDSGLFRVTVDYKVPVNFYLFTHKLSFHASGAGFAAHSD